MVSAEDRNVMMTTRMTKVWGLLSREALLLIGDPLFGKGKRACPEKEEKHCSPRVNH